MTPSRLLPVPLLLLALARPAAAAPPIPKVAMTALDSANELLGKTTGDDRVVACIDALPFLEIVLANAPQYAFGVGLAAECYYLTEQYEKAVPLLERYVELVPPKARKGDVAEKVEKAELRLMRARQILESRGVSPNATSAANNNPPDDVVPPPPPPPEPVPAPRPEPKVAQPTPPPPEPKPEPRPEPKKEPPRVAAPRIEPKKEPPAKTEPPSAPLVKQLALRAGLSGQAGGLGLGLELRLGGLSFAVGAGGYPVSGGIGYLVPAGPGGVYVDLHALWGGSTPLIARTYPGLGLGATVGYDYRPVSWLSLKAGVGAAHLDGRGTGLVVDLCAGPVLSF